MLGRKLDSIPFSGYHVLILTVLAVVGFVEGYDLSLTSSLLVLAKAPLHLTEPDIRWLVAGPPFMACVSAFAFSVVADHWSRKTVMQVGVTATTFLTLLIPLVQNAADHPASADRPWRRRRRVCGVPDRRGIDAGAAQAHLRCDL